MRLGHTPGSHTNLQPHIRLAAGYDTIQRCLPAANVPAYPINETWTGQGLAAKISFLAPLVYPPKLTTALGELRDEAYEKARTDVNLVLHNLINYRSGGP